MPVTSFTPAIVWDFTAPSEPAAPVAAAVARPPKRVRKKRPPGPRKLMPQVTSLLDDRIEEALEDGRIELLDEEIPFGSLDFTANELVALFRLLFAEAPDEAEAHVREKLKKWLKR